MQILLDFDSEIPIYLQLKHQIIAGIAKGVLQPKEPLPSVRTMAKDIGINQHTVNKTYQMLKQEGYIQIHRQKGVVIHPEGVDKADVAYYHSLEESLHPMIADAICRQVTKEDFQAIIAKLYQIYEHKGDDKK